MAKPTGAGGNTARRVQRSVRGSSKVNTTNLRSLTYRVAGQIYTRLLFPEVEPDAILPQELGAVLPWEQKPGYAPLFKKSVPLNSFEQTLFQPRLCDYTIAPVDVEVSLAGIKRKHFWGVDVVRQARKLASLHTDRDGMFSFSPLQLKLDEIYEVIAEYRCNEPGWVPERVRLRFRVKRKEVRRMKQEVMDVEARAEHLFLKPGGTKWHKIDEYPIKPKFCWPGSSQPVLWFGGPASIVFGTFVLDVPYLNQHQDLQDPGRDLTVQFRGKAWRIPIKGGLYGCLSTCVAMVLRHLGLKGVTIEDVMRAAGLAFLETNVGKARLGLSEEGYRKGILELELKDGSYPHCVRQYLVKAAEKLLSQGGVPKKEIITGLCQTAPTKAGWENTRCMLASGWPVIAVKELAEFEEGSIHHAVVISGAIADHKGDLFGVLVRDPNRERRLHGTEGKLYGQQIIVARRFTQKQLCGDPRRVLNAGQVPTPPRMLQPRVSP